MPHDGHDDFQIEPIRGLPATPPEGERILWQGAPCWRAMARDVFKIYWVLGYFALIALWRAAEVGAARGLADAAASALPLLILGLIAAAILALMAYVLAVTTVYTITTRRIAMRIGAALTVTLNLPYKWVGAVDYLRRSDGTGSIALSLLGETRLSYLVCWPHVRPWRMSRTQPTLRCVPEVETVATLLAEAAEARLTSLALEPAAVAAPLPAAVPGE